MPGRNGYEFIAALRARGVRAPAFAHADDRRKALAAGYQAHLAKAVATADLLAALARLARQTQ